MAVNNVNPDAEIFLKKIEEAENQANQYAAFIKKLKARLSRTKKALASKPAVASQVSALVSDLEQLKPDPSAPSMAALSRSLDDELKKLQERLRDSFPSDLRNACEAAELPFTALPDGFGVGPFFVTVNVAKESAAFQFAKTDMGIDVPMNVTAIVEQAKLLKASLLDEPVDLSKFVPDLNEAMRVVLARQGKIPKTEWRAELPLVFREMAFIRQSQTKRRKSSKPEYSPCRFVVELKHFLQSTDNMRADEQYRPETAVLENTKNPKKSVFIPRDMSRAFGEGTYYQAILLRII
jgi:hypothetical protein